jgi:ergothioneine biosynthesis protein EgtB
MEIAVALPMPMDTEQVPLAEQYRAVRQFSVQLCAPLVTEDYVIQSMPDVSPTKWHLAHTTWFWETFVLTPHVPDYRPFHPRYVYLFNSYYVNVGERFFRPNRGLLARPTVEEVYRYRAWVDEQMTRLLETASEEMLAVLHPLVEIGLHHEQQHQELILTDIKHVFSMNPLFPVFREQTQRPTGGGAPVRWVGFDEGLYEIGHDGVGFAFDNEGPRHRVFLNGFQLASRPVTNGEYLAFLEDGGYRRPTLWLSAGWATVEAQGWAHPLYWHRFDDQWFQFTLSGLRAVDPEEPVTHLSYFEAEAFARWSGCRLPTEQEWEVAARNTPMQGHFVEDGWLHPVPAATSGDGLAQLYGDVWEWTQSPYSPYPGYRPVEGALGEYNGKFMCNQFVLRGGSCATSASHIRPTYRNFFLPDARWQFTGLRLAQDV